MSYPWEVNGQGVTFILATHDLGGIERLAGRTIVINHGGLVFNDSIGVLKRRPGGKKHIRISTVHELSIESVARVLYGRK